MLSFNPILSQSRAMQSLKNFQRGLFPITAPLGRSAPSAPPSSVCACCTHKCQTKLYFFICNTAKHRNSSSEVFYEIDFLKNITKFTGIHRNSHLCRNFCLSKVPALMPATLLKQKLQCRCFLWLLQKFKKLSILQNIWEWLLLKRKHQE